MNVGESALAAILDVFFIILEMIKWLVIAAAVVSWVNPDPRNPIVQFLYRSTDPILRPFRRILPPRRTANIDFSPLLVVLLIYLLRAFLTRLLLVPRAL